MFIGLSLLLSLFISCSDNVSPIENDQLEIIPLKVGNEWKYETTTSDSTGKIDFIEYDIQSVLKDTIISDIRWYQYNNSNSIWYTNKEDGYWVYKVADPKLITDRDTSHIVFKHNYDNVAEYNGFEVISVDTMIVVPAGNFNCIHLSWKWNNSNNYLLYSYEIFLSPGIGQVKWEQVGELSNNQKFIPYKGELTRYLLK
ncbi:MAG: hypothetical protein IPM32_10845 [Ignavibacteriae bacterium]|nr:hypothetical protein [Ignavibacteriota bacterium]